MIDENKTFETWKEVIVNFFEYKVAESNLFKARKYIEEKDKKISNEKNEQKREKLIEQNNEKFIYLSKARNESPSGEIRQWLDGNSDKKIQEGKRIIKATHVLKFSHSSSGSEGLILNEKSNDLLLTTAAFKENTVFDIAHNNGALITISRFLALKLSGKMIIDAILNDDFIFLEGFYKNKEQLEFWVKGFSNLVESREIKTTDKAKQIYFPLITSETFSELSLFNYHLVSPLFSSSMAEVIYSKVRATKFSNIKKINSKNGDVNKYNSNEFIMLPGIGVQKFGGAQPQNISMLNKSRTFNTDPQKTWGVTYLLPTQPPTWKNQLKPPVYKKSMFDESFFYQNMKEDINYLRDFLLRFKRIDLSTKKPERQKWIDRWLANIIDEFLFFVGGIQNLPPGWSAEDDIKLKPAHQYLLDPYRKSEAFQTERNASDWQAVVCKDFASWLNRRLTGKDKQFTPQLEHRRMWETLLKKVLREHSEMLDLELKFQVEAGA